MTEAIFINPISDIPEYAYEMVIEELKQYLHKTIASRLKSCEADVIDKLPYLTIELDNHEKDKRNVFQLLGKHYVAEIDGNCFLLIKKNQRIKKRIWTFGNSAFESLSAAFDMDAKSITIAA